MEDIKLVATLSGLLISVAAFVYARVAVRNTIELAIIALRAELEQVRLDVAGKVNALGTRAAYLANRARRIDKLRLSDDLRALLRDATETLDDDAKISERVDSFSIPDKWIEQIWTVRLTREAHVELLKFVQ